MSAVHALDTSLSVNEILRRYPESVGILNAHGVDTCCGGAETLEAAARDAHIDLQALAREIAAVADPAHGASERP